MHENEIDIIKKAVEAVQKAIEAVNEALAEKIDAFNELAKMLEDSVIEIHEQAPFKPCMRIGTVRTYNGDTRKLWQKNKALYLCPYMSKSLRHKNTKSRRASSELF